MKYSRISRNLCRCRRRSTPSRQGYKRREPDWEQHTPLIAHLALAGLGYFRFHPLALHAVQRQDQQQLVVQADGGTSTLEYTVAFVLDVYIQIVYRVYISRQGCAMAVTMTSIRLDTDLADEAVKVLGAKSRTDAVHIALREIVALNRFKTLMKKNSGKLKFSGLDE
jgi:Arc/MetJ family transcription regulator